MPAKAFSNSRTLIPGRSLSAVASDNSSHSTKGSAVGVSRPLLVSLEGNIGAGKSTLLNALRAKRPDWIFIDEPLAFWTSVANDDGKNLLETFYSDTKRWSFTFQACALISRFKNIENQLQQHLNKHAHPPSAISAPAAHDGSITALKRQFRDPSASLSTTTAGSDKPVKVFITERSLQTDYEVFTKMLAAAGSLNSLEMAVYRDWYDMMIRTATPLKGIIHVNQTPAECLNRIRSRARGGEDSISLDYLQRLDNALLDWMGRARATQCPVLSITTGDSNSKHNDEAMNKTIEDCSRNIIDFVGRLELEMQQRREEEKEDGAAEH